MDGVNPIMASFATVIVLTVIPDVLVAGFMKRCVVAGTDSIRWWAALDWWLSHPYGADFGMGIHAFFR